MTGIKLCTVRANFKNSTGSKIYCNVVADNWPPKHIFISTIT